MRSALILLLFLILFSCTKDPNVVADVGKLKITKQELKEEFKIRYTETSLNPQAAIKAYEGILDNLILKKLKMNEAYDDGLAEEESIKRAYNNQKRNIISNRYYKIFVVDKLFPEEVVRSRFEKIRKEVKAKSILLSFGQASPALNERIRGQALILASDISSRAQNGEDFIQLVRQYSDEPGAKETEGDMGYITWDEMLEPHKKAAFDLSVGAVSGPVLTRRGYYVIKVEDKRINQRYKDLDFEEQKDQLVYSLYNMAKDSADNVWIAHLNQIKIDKDYRYNNENILAFLYGNIKKKNEENLKPDSYSEDELNMVISTWEKGKFQVKDLLDSFGQNRPLNYIQLSDSVKLLELIENVSSHHFIMKIGEDLGLESQPQVAFQLNKYMEYLLLKELEQIKVKNEARLTDIEIKDYYDRNNDEFSIPEKIEIWEIFIKDQKVAESVFEKAKSGQNFSALVKKYSQDKVTAENNGAIGFKGINERGEVSKIAFQQGANQIIGPVKYRDGWVVAKTGTKTAKIIRPLNVVETQISRKLLQERLIKKNEDWEKELREKYDVTIYNDVLAGL